MHIVIWITELPLAFECDSGRLTCVPPRNYTFHYAFNVVKQLAV